MFANKELVTSQHMCVGRALREPNTSASSVPACALHALALAQKLCASACLACARVSAKTVSCRDLDTWLDDYITGYVAQPFGTHVGVLGTKDGTL